jgi:hypothetical protein
MILFTLFATLAASSAHAGTNVGVSISVNEPGLYGRIDIGNIAPPPVVYAQPVVIAPTPVAVYQRPIYLYVPPVHQANWKRYCTNYAACGQPVYFVQEGWAREHYHRGRGEADSRGHGRKKGHGGKRGD